MIAMREIAKFMLAEPFRPFRIRLATGRFIEIEYPEMIAVGRSTVAIYGTADETPDASSGWRRVAYELCESIEAMDASSNP